MLGDMHKRGGRQQIQYLLNSRLEAAAGDLPHEYKTGYVRCVYPSLFFRFFYSHVGPYLRVR